MEVAQIGSRHGWNDCPREPREYRASDLFQDGQAKLGACRHWEGNLDDISKPQPGRAGRHTQYFRKESVLRTQYFHAAHDHIAFSGTDLNLILTGALEDTAG